MVEAATFVLHLLYTVYGLWSMFRPWMDSEKCAINKYFVLFLRASHFVMYCIFICLRNKKVIKISFSCASPQQQYNLIFLRREDSSAADYICNIWHLIKLAAQTAFQQHDSITLSLLWKLYCSSEYFMKRNLELLIKFILLKHNKRVLRTKEEAKAAIITKLHKLLESVIFPPVVFFVWWIFKMSETSIKSAPQYSVYS